MVGPGGICTSLKGALLGYQTAKKWQACCTVDAEVVQSAEDLLCTQLAYHDLKHIYDCYYRRTIFSGNSMQTFSRLTLTPCAFFFAQQDHLGVLNYVIDCLIFVHR